MDIDKPMTARQFALILWGPVVIAAIIWGIVIGGASRRAAPATSKVERRQSEQDGRDLQRHLDQVNAIAAGNPS